MNTIEFFTQYLNSPIVAHRNKSLLRLFEEANLDQKTIRHLGINLASGNLDIILNSLYILQAISLEDSNKLKFIREKIEQLGQKTNHFIIASLCRDILINIIFVYTMR